MATTTINLKKIFYTANGLDKVIDLGNSQVTASEPIEIPEADKTKLNKFLTANEPTSSDKLDNSLAPVLGGASSLEQKFGKSRKGGKRRLRKSKKSKKSKK